MKKIILLYVVASFYWVGLYMYPAILPGYIQDIVHDLSLTGAILSMYGLLQIFIRLPLGIASDALGNRKFWVYLGLIALGVGPLVLSSSKSAAGLFVGRAITGIAAGTWVPLSTLILNIKPTNLYKTTSILSFISNLGSVIAVFIAPFLVIGQTDFSIVFLSATISAILALLIFVLIKDDTFSMKTPFSIQLLKNEITNPNNILPGILCAIVQFGVFISTFTFIPLIGKGLDFSTTQLGSLMILFFIVSMISNIIFSRIFKPAKRIQIAILAFLLLGTGITLMGFSKSYEFLFIAQILVGIAYGLNYPLLLGLIMSTSNNANRTIAMGIFQSLYSIGMFAGPPVSTFIAERYGVSNMAILVSSLIFSLGALMLYFYSRHLNKKYPEHKSP